MTLFGATDLRFRQVCGKSVLEEILDVRLAEARRYMPDRHVVFDGIHGTSNLAPEIPGEDTSTVHTPPESPA